jgi:hypothetical protein
MRGIDSTGLKGLGVSAPILVIEVPRYRAIACAPCGIVLFAIALATLPGVVPGVRDAVWFPAWARDVGVREQMILFGAVIVSIVLTAKLATWLWEERPRTIELYETHVEVLAPSKIEQWPWGCFASFDDANGAHVDLRLYDSGARTHVVRVWTPGDHERAVVLELVVRKGLARVER